MLLKEQQGDQEVDKILVNLNKMRKWDRFRQARQIVLDEYLKRKRVQRQAEMFVRIYLLHQLIKHLNENYKTVEHMKEVKLKSAFMCLKIGHLWKRRYKRWGGSHERIVQGKLKKALTFKTNIIHETKYEAALIKLKTFIVDNQGINDFKLKVREFFRIINYIQKRVRDQLSTKYSKVDVLLNYWDKIAG